MLTFDHLAIAAPDLDLGASWLAGKLGVAPEPGGAHGFMGTHNRLLRLGDREYLELIAIDPAAPAPPHPRWFGLDSFSGPPRGVGWVLRSDDLNRDLPTDYPVPQDASRGDLHWRITIPESGQMPMEGLLPMLIEWSGTGQHPAASLPDAGLRLRAIHLTHPAPERLSRALPPLDDARVRITEGSAALRFLVNSPAGDIWL